MGEIYNGERVGRECGLGRWGRAWSKEVVKAVGLGLFCIRGWLGGVGSVFDFIWYVKIGEFVCIGD